MTSLNLTPIEFGKNAIAKLAPFVTNKYQKALLVTGKNSIKNNGLYEQIKEELTKAKVEMVEFFGIKPNPTNQQIDQAAKYGIANQVDLVIGAGGGSAIDAAKIIATMIANKEVKSSWDLITHKVTYAKKPIDLISIITLAGTASENNAGSVVTNEKEVRKQSMGTRKPVLCIADPTYTQSVSKWQTASGIFDAFSHTLEQFNSLKGSFNWTDNYNLATLKTLVTNAPKVLQDLTSYEARANILFAATMALNGLASFNMPDSDWNVHALAHAIAAKYDTTHGATLALVTPTYSFYRAQKDQEFKNRLLVVGKEIFQTKTVESTIKAFQDFIKLLGLPQKWSDFEVCANISDQDINEITHNFARGISISQAEILEILQSISK